MVKKIILVFKTHFDIGFTDLASNVIHGYGNEMLRQVIETCRATEDMGKLRYVWTMPAWPLYHICNHCDPALKPELDRLIENGQIVWHSLPFTTHTDFSVPDEYMQSLRYSRELARAYNKPIPMSAKMTDVPGHGLMLPELLSQAGIRFLHLGCNEFATPPRVPELFFWESPAGGRVLTMYSPGGYGTGLVPPEDWPFPVYMALMHTHDNCGPQSAGLIRKMAEKAREACPEAEIVCGSMDDFYRELAKCDLSGLPVVRQDLADTWIHGVGSYPHEVRALRTCRERARKLHMASFETFREGKTLPPELEDLWKQYYDACALFTEHTWGADVKTWLGPDRVYDKEDFREARKTERYRFMERSWAEESERAQTARLVLDRIGTYLPLSAGEPEKHCALREEKTGDTVTVSGGRYTLKFSAASGKILELFDGRLHACLLKAGEEGALSYRYDRYGYDDINEFLRTYGYHFTAWGIQDYGRENYPFCPHETFYPVFDGYAVEDDTLTLKFRMGESARLYGDCHTLCLKLSFREEVVLAELSLTGKEASPFVESGSFVIPFAENADIRIGKPGGVVDPERDIADCANHAMFNLEREVTLLGERTCLSVYAPDTPLFGIGTPGVYEYHKQYGPRREPRLYFNLFNNMWGTNFPQWMEGDFSYRFVLRGCTRQEAEDAPRWAGELARGCQPGIPEGMELDYAAWEGDTFLIALRDLTGVGRDMEFRLPGAELTPVDLFRRPVGEPRQDAVSFPVRPYSMHLFAIKRR